MHRVNAALSEQKVLHGAKPVFSVGVVALQNITQPT